GSGLMGAGGSMPLLCEENRDQYGAVLEEIEEVRNPYACSVTHDPEKVPGERFQIDKSGGDHDCYDLAIIMNGSTVMRDVNENGSASMPYTKLVSRRITVAITSPKTPEAQIVAVKSEGYEIAENELIGGTWLEPNITSDGKLIVTRIGTNYHPINEENVAACEDIAEYPGNWPNSGQTPICRSVDVVYSYNPGTRCDVNGFTAYQPMAHAYWDDRLNPEVNRDSNTGNDVDAKYGFAAHQLRSPDGKYFEDNQDVQGSYAWMDRHGDNFMVTIGGTQTYDS